MNKQIEKARKILALAKHGEGGERLNAERQLEAFLKRHQLTMSDIEDESQETHEFSVFYSGNYEKILLLQIIDMTFNAFQSEVFQDARIRMPHIHIKGTKSQEVQIRLYFEVLRKKLDEELMNTVFAFINANEIFYDHPPLSVASLTPEQLEKRAKISMMACMMEKTNVVQQISQEIQ